MAIGAAASRAAIAIVLSAVGLMPAIAQPDWVPPRTPDGQINIQGYWAQRNNVTTYSLQDGEGDRAEHVRITGQRAATGKPIVDPPNGRIPYQPWSAAKAKFLFDAHQGAERPEDLDPVARGFMEGTPRINLQTGFQILQTPGHVVFLYEYGHHYRVVPIDGRPHLDGNVLLWMGDSRGHWEGRTLVIDVTNHNDQSWFDQVGSFHSTALRVTERWSFVGPDRLDYEVTITDPKVFTQPWTMRMNYGRNDDPDYEHMESAVWEGNKAVELMVRPKAQPAPKAQSGAVTVSEHDVIVHGMKIHYVEAGRGAPVILLHGSGGEGARWMPTIRGLAANYRVIALDQIGFGQSDKPPANYHTGVFAGFLQGFMKATGIPRATVIGQSMGAGVALYFAIHHPDMVDHLVLVNGGGFRSSATQPRSATPDWHARQISNAGTLEESREYLEKLYYDDTLVTDELVEYNLILRLKSAYTVESMSNAGERGLGITTEEEVRALKTPTLLLWGKDDVVSGPANADRLNAAIPGSRKVLIEKAGHYPFIEQPATFNSAVLEFLKSSPE